MKKLNVAMMLFLVFQGCSGSKSTVTLKGSDNGAAPATLSRPNFSSTGTINASELKIKVYKFAVSESADCTNPILIFEDSTGIEKDLAASPSFGSGEIDDGTYPCVMIEASKIIKTSAAVTSGDCTKDLEFSDVICNDTQKSQLIDGTSVSCSGGNTNDQHVTLFITTLSSGNGDGVRALLPPETATDTNSSIVLTNPFVVNGDVAGTLSVSLVHFLGSGSGVCFTSPPPFSFE